MKWTGKMIGEQENVEIFSGKSAEDNLSFIYLFIYLGVLCNYIYIYFFFLFNFWVDIFLFIIINVCFIHCQCLQRKYFFVKNYVFFFIFFPWMPQFLQIPNLNTYKNIPFLIFFSSLGRSLVRFFLVS